MPYSTTPTIGVALAEIHTTPQFKLGTQVQCDNAALFEYVYAKSTVAVYDAVCISTSGNAQPVSTALAVSIKKIGFAQVAITSAQYGWVARSGNNIRVNVAANCAAGAQLYTTATAGVLDDAVVTAALVAGLTAVTSISTATHTDVIAGTLAFTVAAAPGS